LGRKKKRIRPSEADRLRISGIALSGYAHPFAAKSQISSCIFGIHTHKSALFYPPVYNPFKANFSINRGILSFSMEIFFRCITWPFFAVKSKIREINKKKEKLVDNSGHSYFHIQKYIGQKKCQKIPPTQNTKPLIY
jgi:hypothetical protein